MKTNNQTFRDLEQIQIQSKLSRPTLLKWLYIEINQKNLPEGWRYEPEFIKEEFINISDGNTRIVQDEFRNTYQIKK